jgi:hypothetical protein
LSPSLKVESATSCLRRSSQIDATPEAKHAGLKVKGWKTVNQLTIRVSTLPSHSLFQQ